MAGSLSDKPAVDLAREFVSAFRGFFGDRVGRFSVKDIVDGDGHTEFSVLFDIYAFFPLRFNFDRGAFGFSIDYGERGISVEPVTGWPEFTDLSLVATELDREIRMRIPERFLEDRGWTEPLRDGGTDSRA
ncbi:hypothetical protein MTES_1840 [Microbacterium testaceum StLB037]|uniref:Uncharacterized protein n=1 Tax=Microbacterium testaceum (strain StLB037) TaxID=979556 RepID=E8NBX1_MICTS|nr:hypothetical protein [Microbacterium testaceum]BAJ74804.1 hypothetical protein MTES_1840 [Microbacterium testaceum StLB037]